MWRICGGWTELDFCGLSEGLCLRRNLYFGSGIKIQGQMIEGGFELFFRLRHLLQGISSHPQKTRCRWIWGGGAFFIVWLLESHWISLNFNTLHCNLGYSPHFILPSSPTGLGVRGGVNRYSLWTVKPYYCAKARLSFHSHSLGAIKMPSFNHY